jgi:hypothetical protein
MGNRTIENAGSKGKSRTRWGRAAEWQAQGSSVDGIYVQRANLSE